MRHKSRSLIPIFVVVLIFGLVLGVLNGYRACLPLILHEKGTPVTAIGIYMTNISLASFVVNPALVLVGVYLAGRNIDLKAKLGSSIVLLIVGSYVGNLIGYVIASVIGRPELLPTSLFAGLCSTSFLQSIWFLPVSSLI